MSDQSSMYWDDSDKTEFVVPDDVADVTYRLNGGRIPIDHSHALAEAMLSLLPWMSEEPLAGIHCIHIPEAGNGWMRPDRETEGLVYLSKRTRMTLRLPKHRLTDSEVLEGQVMRLGDAEISIGKKSNIKPLSSLTTVFSRFVVCDPNESEAGFVERAAGQLREQLDIRVRKMLPGKLVKIATPDGDIATRSLMLAGIEPEESVRLQQQGLGPHRLLGCGLFIPHKGIDAVYKKESDE